MRLKNKKTGQEGNFIINKDHFECVDLDYVPEYRSIAELNEEWEDYKNPKKYYVINPVDWKEVIGEIEYHNDNTDRINKAIGNYFETKEEAEKAVEKLKAWKRLKDKGFEFCCDIKYESLCGNGFNIPLNAIMPPEAYIDTKVSKDLDLLFSGEDD